MIKYGKYLIILIIINSYSHELYKCGHKLNVNIQTYTISNNLEFKLTLCGKIPLTYLKLGKDIFKSNGCGYAKYYKISDAKDSVLIIETNLETNKYFRNDTLYCELSGNNSAPHQGQ